MELQGLFPKYLNHNFDIIVINFGITYLEKLYPIINKLRNAGKKIDIYPDKVKLNKQFSYANKHNVNYAIIMGEDEYKKEEVIIKNMKSGSQSNYSIKKINPELF